MFFLGSRSFDWGVISSLCFRMTRSRNQCLGPGSVTGFSNTSFLAERHGQQRHSLPEAALSLRSSTGRVEGIVSLLLSSACRRVASQLSVSAGILEVSISFLRGLDAAGPTDICRSRGWCGVCRHQCFRQSPGGELHRSFS